MIRTPPNNRFERFAGRGFGKPKEWVDDLYQSASFFGNATPRRSTSSLDAVI
jgi:hypothetical protein